MVNALGCATVRRSFVPAVLRDTGGRYYLLQAKVHAYCYYCYYCCRFPHPTYPHTPTLPPYPHTPTYPQTPTHFHTSGLHGHIT